MTELTAEQRIAQLESTLREERIQHERLREKYMMTEKWEGIAKAKHLGAQEIYGMIAEAVAKEREEIAQWIALQRIDTPANGWEFAEAIRARGTR